MVVGRSGGAGSVGRWEKGDMMSKHWDRELQESWCWKAVFACRVWRLGRGRKAGVASRENMLGWQWI